MKIPTEYRDGYERARARNADIADRYMEHVTIGDPLGDALVEEVSQFEPAHAAYLLKAGMDLDEDVLREAPPVTREFFNQQPPDWVDYDEFAGGRRLFHRNSDLVLAGMLAGVLVEGFSTNISKSFFITGRVRDRGVRRLQQNNRHMIELFFPGGLRRWGDGWKLSVRIRIIHAQIRRLLTHSEDWDQEAWGTALSAAHIGYASASFSARLLKHMRALGGKPSAEERASFMQVWRYCGHLMGVPEKMLFTDEEEALEIFDCGTLCEPPPGPEARVMAHSLVNSAPLVAGINSMQERQALSNYIFQVSRALIGTQLANQLDYPASVAPFGTTFGILAVFRLTERYQKLLNRLFPNRARSSNAAKISTLFEVSHYDDSGIHYRIPDHVYAEESGDW